MTRPERGRSLDRNTKSQYKSQIGAAEFLKQGESPRDKSISPADLAAYTGVASLILNLDEAVTKE